MATLQDRIKERRQTLGLTLLQIADSLGVKEATVQRYESGEIKNIKHETILALSEILYCNPAYLMGWSDEMEDKAKARQDTEQYALDLLSKLSPEGQKKAEEYLLFLQQQESREDK